MQENQKEEMKIEQPNQAGAVEKENKPMAKQPEKQETPTEDKQTEKQETPAEEKGAEKSDKPAEAKQQGKDDKAGAAGKKKEEKKKTSVKHKVFSIIGIVLCVILLPILVINCTLLIKSKTNPDEVPDFAGVMPLIVLSGSMNEEFPEGSLIISKKILPEEVKEGDIISYVDPSSKTGAIVTHKVWRIDTDAEGELVFLTFGTANVAGEEYVTEFHCAKIPEQNLVGIYTGVRFLLIGDLAMFMQTTGGFIVCVFVPLLAIVSYDVIRRVLKDKKKDEDKDKLLKELEELRKLKNEKEKKENQEKAN